MLWLIILSCLSAASPGDNLIYNGDFELPSSENPPPGWTMWGARRYKIPDNYTRELPVHTAAKPVFAFITLRKRQVTSSPLLNMPSGQKGI